MAVLPISESYASKPVRPSSPRHKPTKPPAISATIINARHLQTITTAINPNPSTKSRQSNIIDRGT